MMRKRIASALASFAVLSVSSGAAFAGEIRALTIGIDDYVNQVDLYGSVNDARDLAAALKGAGARDVTTLEDRKADRDSIFAAWRSMVARAAPDDMLVLTISSHGAREPARRPDLGVGGYEEPLLLSGFASTAPGNYQRIFENELRQELQRAGDRQVLLLVDACYSGSPTRDVRPLNGLGSRLGNYGPIENDLLPLPQPAAGASRQPSIVPNWIVIGGSLETERVHEIRDDKGAARGPASLMLGRAIRGAADADRNGELSVGELRQYLIEGVRRASDGRQNATVTFAGSETRSLLETPAIAAGKPGPLRFAFRAESAADERKLAAGLRNVEVVTVRQARLVWDRKSGKVHTDGGDHVGDAASLAELQPIIDKWRLIAYIDSQARAEPLKLRLDGGDRIYRPRDTVSVTADVRRERLLLFNLARDGTVQKLYPYTPGEAAARLDTTHPFRIPEFEVTPPFGQDEVIAINASAIPDAWLAAVDKLNGKQASEDLLTLLHGWVTSSSQMAIGRVGLYTAER